MLQATLFVCFLFLCDISRIKADDDDEHLSSKKINYVPIVQSPSSNSYFEEQFQDKSKWSRWIRSKAKKDGVEEKIAKYDGEWGFEVPSSSVYEDDYGLILKSPSRHHAISSKLDKPFDFTTNRLIVQYEVKFQTKQECGGGYLKLLSDDGSPLDLEQVTDKTSYTIMFGPDTCGSEYKYHFIIRYRNPKTGLYNEHHAKKPKDPLDDYFTDQKTHLYTLVLSSDNNFKMYIDNKLITSGNLLQDMEPPIIPPKEIDDETDHKPADWEDEEKIVDKNARKPDDWDENAPREITDHAATRPDGWLENEPLTIPDPEATKPDDWDDGMDGAWEAPSIDNPRCKNGPGCGKWKPPMIPNPAYKGKWSPPMIDNPNYRGKWEPRKIPNPNYFDGARPYELTPIAAVTFELWSLVNNIVFDNILITSHQSLAKKYADQLWSPKMNLEEGTTSSPSSTVATSTTTEASTPPTTENLINSIKQAIAQDPQKWLLYAMIGLVPLLLVGMFYPSNSSKKDDLNKVSNAPTTDSEDNNSGREDIEIEDEELSDDEDEDEDEEEDAQPVTQRISSKKVLKTESTTTASIPTKTNKRRYLRKE